MPAILSAVGALMKAIPVINWVGAVGANGTGANMTMTMPAGYQTGDLLIYVGHGGPDNTPTGFTSVFSTAADPYGYVKYVKYKISAGETSITANASTGFDVYLIVLRGYTTVSATHQFSSVAAGSSATYTVSGGPKNVLAVASDRGASSLPSVSSTGRTGLYTYTGATYFRGAVGFYPSLATSATASGTDFSDTYNTSVLFLTMS